MHLESVSMRRPLRNKQQVFDQRASATADIERTLTVRWERAKNKPVVVGVVIPTHPQSLGRVFPIFRGECRRRISTSTTGR
jgi:hypothetical protein